MRTPVSLFVATTEACTSTAPVESFTVPEILPPMPGDASAAGQNAARVVEVRENAKARDSQIGTFHLARSRLDLAEKALIASIDLTGTGAEGDAINAPTYEELAQIASRKENLKAAAEYWSRAAEARIRQNRPDKAAFDFQASVPLLLASGNDVLAAGNADRFLALREASLATSVSNELDQEFVESIARYANVLGAETLHALSPVPGRSVETSASEAFEKADRWIAIAKRSLALSADPETHARVHYAAAAASLRSDPRGAVQNAEAALPFFEKSEDRISHIGLLELLAEAYRRSGAPEQTLAVLEQALTHMKGVENRAGVLSLLARKVAALASLGRARDALELATSALGLARQGGDALHKYYQGSLTASISSIHLHARRIESAVPAALEALRVARDIGARGGEAQQFAALGMLTGMLCEGWAERIPSSDRWKMLAAIARESLNITFNDARDEMSEEALADCAAEIGKNLFDRAIQLYRQAGDIVGEAVAQGNLSNFRGAQAEQRIDVLQNALVQLRKGGGLPRSEAILLANMGKSYLHQSNLRDALTCFEHSLSLSEMSGDCEWAYDTAADLATTHIREGRFNDGVKYLRRAMDYTEAARARMPLDDATRIAFARGKAEIYARLVALYVDNGRIADAFDIVQRAKSRALVDLSAVGAIRPSVPMTAELASLLEREQDLLRQVRSRSFAQTDPAVPSAERSLSDIFAALGDVYESLQSIDPRYVAIRSGRPTSFRELKQTLTEYKRAILLVEYFVQHDAVLLFVLRPEWNAPKCIKKSLDYGQLAAFREDFERQVVRYRGQGPQTWNGVAELLVEPFAELLQQGDIVYLVPHDLLHGLPIHALPLDGGVMIDAHAVVYLPAASLLSICQIGEANAKKPVTACAVGIEFEEEARAVAALIPGCELLLGDVSGSQIAEAAADRDLLHVSSHGHYDPIDTNKSGLVLRKLAGSGPPTDGAVLTSEHIMQMRLRADLVFLSACQTGVARLVDGDEQLGILRAFFLAGASSVISTLWPVDAEATREFVICFYSRLLETFKRTQTLDKLDAFHHAQQESRRRHGEAGTYLWAPFLLSGAWS